MSNGQEVWAAGLSFEFVAAVGSIGWVLGILCLFARFDRKKGSKICLVSDLVGKTFIAVTFVGVIALTIEFAVYLSRSEAAQAASQNRIAVVLAGQDGIRNEIANLPLPVPESIGQAIDAAVQREGKISDEALTAIVRTGFGKVTTDGFSFRTEIQRVNVSCVDFGDGGGLQCSQRDQ